MMRIKIMTTAPFILVLFMALPCISTNISHYYITPHRNTSCPAVPCLTLDQYVQDVDHYFTSNTTFVFLDGEHELSTYFALRDVTNITLIGNTSSLPQVISKIRCTGPVSIAFDAVSEIKVSALAFASCGVDTSNDGAIHLGGAQNVSFSDCILHDNAFIALSAWQSSLTLNNVTIANNSQSALKIYSSTVHSICSTFCNNSGDQGGAAAIFNSYVKFTGSTVLESNSALGSGGSLYLQGTTASFTGVNFFRDSHARGRGYWSQGQYISAGGGVLYATSSYLHFEGETSFISGSSAGDGGGIIATNYTTIKMNGNYNFINNSANGDGGGISAYNHTTLNMGGNYSFINNSASYGGGISTEDNIIMNFHGNYNFIDNSASRIGGGIFVYNHNTLIMDGNYSFINNGASYGGGVSFLDSVTVNLNGDCSFINNSASGDGGGIFVFIHTKVNMDGTCSFINNSASYGGGISFLNNITVNLNGNYSFINNSAIYGGGMSFLDNITVNLNGNYSFINNSANEFGGGICAYSHSIVNLNGNCSFINNSASGDGGGISAYNHTTLNMGGNYSFINNSASNGGGISIQDNIIMNFHGNYNFIDNSASRNGGGIFAYNHTTVNINGNYSFINNGASCGGGVSFIDNTAVNLDGKYSFINNLANEGGGGVCAYSHSIVSLNGNCSFINNSASEGGGIVAFSHTTVNMDGTCSFISNSASCGGGISFLNNVTANLNGNYGFIDNSVSADGGGISAYNNTTVNMDGNYSFIDNSASRYGGGIFASNHITVNMDGNYSFISNSARGYGGGISAMIYGTMNMDGNCSFINNSASGHGGGIYAFYVTVNFSDRCSFISNSAGENGGGIMAVGGITVTFEGNCSFIKNWASYGGGGSFLQDNITVTLKENCFFVNNSARYGGTIFAYKATMNFDGYYNFIDNSASTNGGGIWAAGGTTMNFDGYYNFINNSATYSGGAIIAVTSTLNFNGVCAFTNNSATYGGGIALATSVCYLFQQQRTRINFTGNRAQRGGAINVFDSPYELVQYCSSPITSAAKRDCFLQIGTVMFHTNNNDLNDLLIGIVTYLTNNTDLNVSVIFEINSALEAGDDVYGGTIDTCLSLDQQTYADNTGEMIDYLAPNITEDKLSAISSDPIKVCICNSTNYPHCVGKINVTSYPGESFMFTAVAVGQRDGTVPAVIHSVFEKDSNASLRSDEILQNSSKSCTTLHYTVFSDDSSEQLNLYAEGVCGPGLGQPLSIPVKLQPCPNGFELSPTTRACVCEKRLQTYTNNCDINIQTIVRDGHSEFWVGYDNETGGLILHPHCPFDYCKSVSISFTLNDSDLQCNYNRSGLLCGSCQPGLSLVLGTSQCLKCSDTYLVLLIAFVLAGLFLVFFLLICRLTVAVGTISGLIFYANIVAVSRFIFIPDHLNLYGRFLNIFIAWLNLDLGIETCFYNGMDPYAKTWLQFVFPFYIWALVGLMIISSRYSPIVARTLGTNPVALLATLFLLSYTKILRTIIAVLAFTSLQYPNDAQTVWLYDGNITYLSGRHIPLFIAALAVFLVLFLPYTILLLIGQFLQVKSNWKTLSWVNSPRLKTLMDAYHGPYRNESRYWPGLLLVVRIILLLTFNLNSLHDPSVNLLAISVCILGLLTLELLIRGIYKNWCLEALESVYILNLGIFAVATLYVQATAGSQAAVAYTSVSAAFVVFIGIVIYHMNIQLRDIWRRRQRRLRALLADNDTAEAALEIQVPSQVELERVVTDETRALVPTTVVAVPRHECERETLIFDASL